MTTTSSAYRHRFQQGFSLLELSIALAVIGVVVAGGLTMSTSMVDRQAYVQTGNQMDEVEKALAAFVAVNKRLPCPSRPSAALDSDKFGIEEANCAGTAAANGMQKVDGTDNRKVWIGGLPVRSLGLRDRFAADEYGNRYTYAVTEAMTTQVGYASSADADKGGIELVDGQNNKIVDDAAYTFVSHGSDGKGAYRFESASNTVACAGGLDAVNCGGTAVFRDARFNRGSVAANWNDDTTRFARREVINLTAGNANGGADQLWEANGDHIYNTNTENVGIGIANPIYKLDVLAGLNKPSVRISTVPTVGGTDHSNATGLIVNTDGGHGADIETWNTQHALLVNSRLNENGVSIITNGNNSKSLNIDHAGDNGIGTQITMNNDNAKALNIGFAGGAVSGTGINIDNSSFGGDPLTTGINLDGVVYGVRVDVDSELGHAIYATSARDNVNLYRAQLTGENAVGMTISTASVDSQGVNALINGDGGYAFYGRIAATAAPSAVFHGEATDTGGNAYGAHLTVAGSNSMAVRGEATNTSGSNIGGYFSSAGNTGRGVMALASGATSYGIYASGGSTGVYGRATSGFGVGLSGESTGANGKGVFGYGLNNGVAYGIYCASGLCGGLQGWTNVSDERLKKNIVSLDDAHGLDAIRKLRPVTYEWKSLDQPHGTQIGFVAQEVEKVIPEVVKNGADQDLNLGDGKKETISKVRALGYAELTAPLVRAVQQLADKLDSLFESVSKLLEQVNGHDAKIKALEAENAALKARLDALEAKLAK